jgi:polysaccharide biosynthesis protein PslG
VRRADRGRILAVAAVVAVVVAVLIAAGSNSGPPQASAPPPTPTPTLTTTPTPTPTPTTAELFGASVNRLFNDRTFTPAQIDAQLSSLRAAGATVARSDALWEASEPAPPLNGVHRYEWAFNDLIAGTLARHGLSWLPIIDYSAPWAQSIPGRDHSPPRSVADYAAYAAALAARYGSGGSFWREHPRLAPLPVDTFEVWNEPDNPVFWSPTPDPSRYARLYVAARAAIDAADPAAIVLVGGLTNPRSFMPALLAADPALRTALDGVAIHPYGATPAAVLANVVGSRRVLDSLDLASVPLYVTEFGWTTHPPGARDGAPERLRPRYIEQTIAALGASGCGVAASLLYTWVTPERNPADAQDWFGVSPPAGGGGPDVAAFASGLRRAAATGAQTGCG